MTRCRIPSLLLLGLVLPQVPALAQDSSLVPQSGLNQLDGQCSLSSTPLEVDGETIVLWSRLGNALLARRGPDLDSLGPQRTVVQDEVFDFQAIAGPGSFVVFWRINDFPSSGLSFQRFGADLSPLGLPVVVELEPSSWWNIRGLSLEADGTLTLAWSRDGETQVRVRRYSAANVPLGPAMATPPPAPIFDVELGSSSLLFGYFEQLTPEPTYRMWTRAYSFAGVPLGDAVDHGEATSLLNIAATPEGGFVTLFARGDLRLQRLGPSSEPLEPESVLGLSITDAEAGPLLAYRENRAWLSWLTHGGNLFLAGFDFETQSRYDSLLVAPGEEWGDFHIPSRLEPTAGRVMLGWQRGHDTAILPEPCTTADATFVRAFGPDGGVVDVPTLSALGLALCALIFAISGVALTRCR